MLLRLLNEQRQTILARSLSRVAADPTLRSTGADMARGLPVFFDQLLEMLEREAGPQRGDHPEIAEVAARHGKDLLRAGFTVSQVVSSYGALCDIVTTVAEELATPIEAREFHVFNHCLDVATAAAVRGFELERDDDAARKAVEDLGQLAHELRNVLASAVTAFELIKRGQVGVDGSTGALLERSLTRMRNLIDRSLAEVRLRSKLPPQFERLRVQELFEEVTTTACCEARRRGLDLTTTVDSELHVEADPQLLLSAIANLVQNALKYTAAGGQVSLRGRREAGRVLLEVEDRCGGLTVPSEALFRPFLRAGADRTGLGLGLTIAFRCARANRGDLRVTNLPGRGCVFVIDLPE